MWRPPEEIRADLASAAPARIVAGLRDAVDAMDDADESPLPPLDASLLAPLGAPPPEVQLALARLIAGYAAFEPPLSPVERGRRLVELALAYGDDRIALEAAMAAKLAEDPAVAAQLVIVGLGAAPPAGATAVLGAIRVVAYLLGGRPDVRDATVRGLATLADALADVIDGVTPGLTPVECAQMGR